MGCFGSWRQHIPYLDCYSGPFTESTKNRLVLGGTPNKRRLCNMSRLFAQAALPVEPYGSADSVMFEMSVADGDTLWRLWQAPECESQCRPSWFWSKALPSSADSHSPSEKQLMVCYWVFAETEHLMMGLQLTMHSEAPITNWILSESLSHKIGRAQQFSILKWKQNIRDQSQAGPEDTNK